MSFGTSFKTYKKAESEPQKEKAGNIKNNSQPPTIFSDFNEESLSDKDSTRSGSKNCFTFMTSNDLGLEEREKNISFKNLQKNVPMVVMFKNDDVDLTRLALDGILFKYALYNEAKILKNNTINDPDSKCYRTIFQLIVDSSPYEGIAVNQWNQLVTHEEEIRQIQKNMTQTRVDKNLIKNYYAKVQILLKDFEISQEAQECQEVNQMICDLEDDNQSKSFESKENVCQVLKNVLTMLEKKIEILKNKKSLYWLIGCLDYYSSLDMSSKLAQKMIDKIERFAQSFGNNIKQIIKAHVTESIAEETVETGLESLRKQMSKTSKSSKLFCKRMREAVTAWLQDLSNSVAEMLQISYEEGYPSFQGVQNSKFTQSGKFNPTARSLCSLSSSTEAQRQGESKSDNFSTTERSQNHELKTLGLEKTRNIEKFDENIKKLLASVLHIDSFLFKSPLKVNWQIAREILKVFEENIKMESKGGSFEHQILHKNVVVANLDLRFDQNIHLCFPIYHHQKHLFHSQIAKKWSVGSVEDMMSSRVLYFAKQKKKGVTDFCFNEGHGERAVIAFIIENLEPIIDAIERSLQAIFTENSQERKSLMQISLDLYTTNDMSETCQLLLTHDFPQIYDKIVERLADKFGIVDKSQRKKLIKRVMYSIHRRFRRNLATPLTSNLFVCEEPCSFLDPNFLEKVLKLPNTTSENEELKINQRTYFVSTPESPENLKFSQDNIQKIEAIVAEKMNRNSVEIK